MIELVRRRIRITGIVQGVGFRPRVQVLATDHGLAGTVTNDDQGVTIEAQGSGAAIDAFLTELISAPPPAAVIQQVRSIEITPTTGATFDIIETDRTGSATTLVSPDLDVCDDCLSEMQDPADRRYRYPFINCTNCGPRFSIIRETPYDRSTTTMAGFAMCAPCQAEYSDPGDRRFHAQPNACPACGPTVWIQVGQEVEASGSVALASVRDLVADGGIVAIKGVGGFHLACDATSPDAIRELRRRKHRSAKPFAVMAADLETASAMVEFSDADAALLTSRAKPIVLLPATDHPAADVIAPGLGSVGVMLPYTPLHHLLFEPGDIWVMTSGNLASEPIITENEDALLRLGDVADAFLLHDRDIARPVDDSLVIRTGDGGVPIRRSRGYAPMPIELRFEAPPTLAVGGELKATLGLASGSRAFLSQHIGDMENLETLEGFAQTAADLQALLRIEPEVFVCDMHPSYLSRRWAQDHAGGRPVVEVQHHHAHMASLLAEHGRHGPIIGFSFDGTGYGLDGTVWGGEILVGDLSGFERRGHIRPFTMPGGDVSVRNPFRLALALLQLHGLEWSQDLPAVDACSREEQHVIAQQLASGLNAATTTSAGRLFDAVSSLAGVCHIATYEGQAAMELEALVDEVSVDGPRYQMTVETSDAVHILDHAQLVAEVRSDVQAGIDPSKVAAKFHRGLAHAVTDAAIAVGSRVGLSTVGLSGGVFQNRTLVGFCAALLLDAGFELLTHRLVPPNDAGLALGQLAIAAHQL